MVDHAHLSAGNSMSSQSRDLFEEFGVSNPYSPSLSTPLFLSSDDMGESDFNPAPLAVSKSSEESFATEHELDINIGPALGANAKEIFIAAQHFSQKDRDEALFERKKNLQLMNFLAAHDVSISDVQNFVSSGQLSDFGSVRKVSGTSPKRTGTSAPPLSEGNLVPVSCEAAPSPSVREAPPVPTLPATSAVGTVLVNNISGSMSYNACGSTAPPVSPATLGDPIGLKLNTPQVLECCGYYKLWKILTLSLLPPSCYGKW